jgi:hypothetical protein
MRSSKAARRTARSCWRGFSAGDVVTPAHGVSTVSATLTAQPHDGLAGFARHKAMFAVGLAVLLSVLDYAVVNVALPSIARDIHTSDSAAIWVVNAYQLASVISLLPVAAMGDRMGHARMCRIGLALFVIASLLCAVSRTLPELAAARALQGVGGACIMGVNAALVRYIYPANMLGRGIALNGLVVALGVALGPTVAAGVLAVSTWQWLFLINLPLGGAAFYYAFTALPVTPRIAGAFDYVSTALLALALGGLIIGGDRFAHESARRGESGAAGQPPAWPGRPAAASGSAGGQGVQHCLPHRFHGFHRVKFLHYPHALRADECTAPGAGGDGLAHYPLAGGDCGGGADCRPAGGPLPGRHPLHHWIVHDRHRVSAAAADAAHPERF